MEITGDFWATLKECQTLLEDRIRFGRNSAGFVVNVVWHMTTETRVNHLRERVQLHTAKLFFGIKPFELKLLLEIRNELQELRQEVRLVMNSLYNNAAAPAIHMPELPEIPEPVVRRFLDALNSDPPPTFRNIANLPLEEGFDALVFHFARSTVEFNQGVNPFRRVPEEPQYLNLLKSKWLLDKLRESSQLADAEPDCLLISCLKEVELDIIREYRRFDSERLVAPAIDVIIILPNECFSIWIVETPLVRPLKLTEQRPLEDKILQLTLSDPLATPEFGLTLFRKSDEEFRIVTATTIPGEIEREGCSINMTSTRLIPAYVMGERATLGTNPVNNLLLYRIEDQDPLWQDLKNSKNVEQFQQALTGYRVFYDTRSKVRWSFNGSTRPGECGDGRSQLWQVKRIAKILQDGEVPSSQYASSPITSSHSPSEMEGIRRSSMGSTHTFLSTSSVTSQVTGNRANGIAILPPDPPVLMIYTLHEEKYTFLHVELDVNVFVNRQACRCNHSPQSCKRVVLESRTKLVVRRSSAQEKLERGLTSWNLALFRLPRHPRYREIEILPRIKYMCFDFATFSAKHSFCEEISLLFEKIRDWELDQYWKELGRRQQRTHNRK